MAALLVGLGLAAWVAEASRLDAVAVVAAFVLGACWQAVRDASRIRAVLRATDRMMATSIPHWGESDERRATLQRFPWLADEDEA
jgi:hypothetical protein